MNHEAQIKELLVNNTIRLIAESGFENATTKALTNYGGDFPDFRMNEVYIYRFFGSKEKLYETAFLLLESEMYHSLKNCVGEELVVERDMLQTWKSIFERAWEFVLRNKVRCRYYVRYYYSIYFKGASREKHKEHFNHVLNSSGLSSLFIEEADVDAIMHSVFTTLLGFAIRVYNGEIEDNDINRPHIFNVLYCMMATYLKKDAQCDVGINRRI